MVEQSIDGPIFKVKTNKNILRYALNMYFGALALFDQQTHVPLVGDVDLKEYEGVLSDIANSWRVEQILPQNDAGGLTCFEEYLHLTYKELFQTERMHALRQCLIHIA